MEKILRIGTAKRDYDSRAMAVYIKVQYDGKRFSMSGVEGPLHNGDCLGSCGQIDMHMDSAYLDNLTYAEGWNRASVARMLEIWRDWHLNDCSPTDAAMRADDWHHKARLEMIGYKFTLASEVSDRQRVLKESSLAALAKGERVKWNKADLLLYAMPYDVMLWQYADEAPPATPEGYKAGDYKGERATERKTLGWLYPMEEQSLTKRDCHPDGMLGKLHKAGGRYGSTHDLLLVPDSVIAEAMAWPEATTTPAWI